MVITQIGRKKLRGRHACLGAREHEGTERDTPSPRFVICHSR